MLHHEEKHFQTPQLEGKSSNMTSNAANCCGTMCNAVACCGSWTQNSNDNVNNNAMAMPTMMPSHCHTGYFFKC